MAQTRQHADHPSRVLGWITFIIGIGLLSFVFFLAYHLFSTPLSGLDLPVKDGAPPPPAANIGVALTAFLKQIVLIFIMAIAGSTIANKGIHLYFASAAHAKPVDAPKDDGPKASAPQ